MLDTPAPSPDRPLAAVLDGMLRVFDRVTAAIAAADGIDPRLVQSATSAANAIVRIVQAQARLADPDAELEAEIMRARAELGLLPDLDPHHDPHAAGAPDHAVYPGPGVMPATAAGPIAGVPGYPAAAFSPGMLSAAPSMMRHASQARPPRLPSVILRPQPKHLPQLDAANDGEILRYGSG